MKAYFRAILNTRTDELDALLCHDSSSIDTPDPEKGRTLLSFAATLDKIDMMTLLLAKGATVDAKGADGRTALSYAVQQNKTRAVECLLKNGADPLLKDNADKIALKYAEPGSDCMAPYVIAIGHIAKDDPDESRRINAAKIMARVFKSTAAAITDEIDEKGGELGGLETFMKVTMATAGLDAGAMPSSFFSPSKNAFQACQSITRDAETYGKILSHYLTVRIPSSRMDDYRSILPIIHKGDLLLQSMDVEGRRTMLTSLKNQDMDNIMDPVAEMTILVQFLTYLKSDPDVGNALARTYEQFPKEIDKFSRESKVIAFFRECGLTEVAAAKEPDCAYGCGSL